MDAAVHGIAEYMFRDEAMFRSIVQVTLDRWFARDTGDDCSHWSSGQPGRNPPSVTFALTRDEVTAGPFQSATATLTGPDGQGRPPRTQLISISDQAGPVLGNYLFVPARFQFPGSYFHDAGGVIDAVDPSILRYKSGS